MPVEAAPRVMIAWEAADAAHRHWLHIAHVAHLAHEAHLAAIAEAKAAAIRAAAWAAAHPAPVHHSSPPHAAAVVPAPRTGLSGHLTYGELEQLWVAAGGPVWAEAHAALIAECESGGNQMATNPYSGAAGYWQILGQVVGGWIYSPIINAENAVAKFRASGSTFAQWVCR